MKLSIERPSEAGAGKLALNLLEPQLGTEIGENRLRLSERGPRGGLLLPPAFDRTPGQVRARELKRFVEARVCGERILDRCASALEVSGASEDEGPAPCGCGNRRRHRHQA